MSSGIYRITNTANGKVYYGSAVNIHRRWNEHRSTLRRNVHGNPHLQSAWNKYGEAAFSFEVIEQVDDLDQLLNREQFYIDESNCTNNTIGYNKMPTAGNQRGFKHSEATKRQMSESRRGISVPSRGRPWSEERKARERALGKERGIPEAFRRRHQNQRGEDGPGAKITVEQVIQIKHLLAQGVSPAKILSIVNADMAVGNVYNIKYGKSWTHISI